MAQRMALYLQDKHPIREGMQYVQYAESRGLTRMAGRIAARSRCNCANGCVPAVTDRIKVGSGVITTGPGIPP